MNKLQKNWMPWKAVGLFEDQDTFVQWLKKRLKCFETLRLISLAVAAALLVVGYVLEQRPIMLLTLLPLAVTALLTMAMEKTEAAAETETKSQS